MKKPIRQEGDNRLLEAFSEWGRCGARGRGSLPRAREASASRPPALRPAALEWAGRGGNEGRRKPSG
jgi:hypothetical protein